MRSNVHPVEPEELMAYLDGELPVEQATAAAAHLEECRECQILVAEMNSVSEVLTAWGIESAEPATRDTFPVTTYKQPTLCNKKGDGLLTRRPYFPRLELYFSVLMYFTTA